MFHVKHYYTMEKVKQCEICGDNTFETLFAATDFLVSNQSFTICKCHRCGFIFTNPRPASENMGPYYNSHAYISHTNSKRSLFDKTYQVIRSYMLKKKVSLVLKALKKNPERIALLDYGCATGEFLKVARNKGIKGMGIEPEEAAREQALHNNLFVYPYLEEAPVISSFDCITLWHVLEHIPDLNKILRSFSKILKDNGLIVVAVPEHNSYDARFYREKWAAWDVPRHLNHFDEKTLRNLFSQHGFILKEKHPLMFDSFYVSLLTEKFLKTGLTGVVRAAGIGVISNINAAFTAKPYSSQIYIFRKGEI